MIFPDLAVLTFYETRLPQVIVGDNAFAGPVRAFDDLYVDKACLFVLASGGFPSKDTHNKDRGHISRPIVVVNVRSPSSNTPGAFDIGQEFAWSLFHEIHMNPPGGFCDARALNSQPTYTGMHEGHHEWSFNVLLDQYTATESVYWGLDTDAGPFDEAFVLGLSDTDLTTHRFRKFSVVSGAGDFIYYAFPDTFVEADEDLDGQATAPTFTVTGRNTSFNRVGGTISVNGTDYQLWKSALDDRGSVIIAVT